MKGLTKVTILTIFCGAVAATACSEDDSTQPDAVGGNGATGGTSSTGGKVGTGGTSARGGAGGNVGTLTGGAPASGGAIATGGVPASGGAIATGGATSTAGAPASGGVTSTAGAPASGGATSSAGAPATGGATSAAGAPATGGAPVGTAGTTNQAGSPSTGGATAGSAGEGTAGTAGAPAVNLSIGKTATADSEQTTSTPPHLAPLAIDGDHTTRWTSANGTLPHYITVNLGAAFDVSRVEIMWEKSPAKTKYTIGVSTNNTDWTEVVPASADFPTVQTTSDSFATTSAQYVRVTVTAVGTSTWPSIFELRIYGP